MGHVVSKAVYPEPVEYIRSAHTPNYNPTNWLINPDLATPGLVDSSGIPIIEVKYWKWNGSTSIVEMSQAEKDEIDEIAAELSGLRDIEFQENFLDTVLNDHFWGPPLLVGANSTIVLPRRIAGGIVTIRSGDTANDSAVLAQDNKGFMKSGSCEIQFRTETPQLADSDTELGLSLNEVTGFVTDEVIKFTRSGTGNWFARCISSSTETAVDTGVASVDDGYKNFRIRAIKGVVKFYIDDVLVATIDSNVPTGILEIYAGQKTTGGTATRNLRIAHIRGSSRSV